MTVWCERYGGCRSRSSRVAWAGIARIVRGQTLSLKEKEYIQAARSLGAGPFRIMFIDILPNLLAPVLVLATLYIPAAVVFEATLSFLGLGTQGRRRRRSGICRG